MSRRFVIYHSLDAHTLPFVSLSLFLSVQITFPIQHALLAWKWREKSERYQDGNRHGSCFCLALSRLCHLFLGLASFFCWLWRGHSAEGEGLIQSSSKVVSTKLSVRIRVGSIHTCENPQMKCRQLTFLQTADTLQHICTCHRLHIISLWHYIFMSWLSYQKVERMMVELKVRGL